jgi:hypothetical protein
LDAIPARLMTMRSQKDALEVRFDKYLKCAELGPVQISKTLRCQSAVDCDRRIRESKDWEDQVTDMTWIATATQW